MADVESKWPIFEAKRPMYALSVYIIFLTGKRVDCGCIKHYQTNFLRKIKGRKRPMLEFLSNICYGSLGSRERPMLMEKGTVIRD